MRPGDALRSEIDPDLADSPGLASLRQYWDDKRNGRAMPARRDIDPVELKAHLGSLFLVEPLAEMADFRYRLVGTELTRVYGREITGKTVSEVFARLDARMIASIIAGYRKILRDGVIIRTRGPMVWTNKDFIAFDSVHLPLSLADDKPGLILGKVVMEKNGA